MKPLVRALLVSITAITLGISAHAMDFKTKIIIFANNVKYAYKDNKNIMNTAINFAQFCEKNPVYCNLKNKTINQWQDQTTEQQRIKKFWLTVESCTGNKKVCPDAIIGFGDLICFLMCCAKKNNALPSLLTDTTNDSPWLAAVKKAFLNGIDLQDNHTLDKIVAYATILLESIFWFDPTIKDYQVNNDNFLTQ